MFSHRHWTASRSAVAAACLAAVAGLGCSAGLAADPPGPLLAQGQPVPWWFTFKLNQAAFPNCQGGQDTRACLFDPPGRKPVTYREGFSQQYIFASPGSKLQQGPGCVGDTTNDPLGATFSQLYNGNYHFVVWNDQLYQDPNIHGCGDSCDAPWGHSKGVVAWDDAGDGFVLQVSTPNWPGAGSKTHPRQKNGNTLGCIMQPPKQGSGPEVPEDNTEVSQHFFALKINKDDLVKILNALANASVVTDPTDPQLVANGGPADVQALVKSLGKESKSQVALTQDLSSGVTLISKPSARHVPPWQMVSAILGGVSLRVASWWEKPEIPTTTASTPIKCWDDPSKPGAVEIATTGRWAGKEIGLTGGSGGKFNHAKIGVSTSGNTPYAIFGDMNQQGTLDGPNCGSSQNGRGGLFYVVRDQTLHDSVLDLLTGNSAPAGN